MSNVERNPKTKIRMSRNTQDGSAIQRRISPQSVTSFNFPFTLYCKVHVRTAYGIQNARGLRWRPALEKGLRRRGAGRRSRVGGVSDHLLQRFDVLQEPLAPFVCNPAECLRAVVLRALPDFDQARLLQHLEVPVQVAIRQGT